MTLKSVLRLSGILFCLAFGLAEAAVTIGATTSAFSHSAESSTSLDVGHTVDANTSLLVCSVHQRAVIDVTGTPQWSLGGGENLTLVDVTTAGADAGDQKIYVYGLISPTAGAGTVDIVTESTDYGAATCVNYIGTNTVSVAAATNFLSEDVNDLGGETDENVHASAGNAGNALYLAAAHQGGDGDPASNATGFAARFNDNTGGPSGGDGSYYVADLLNSAPAAITVSWVTTDSNASTYIEIVAAAGASSVAVHRRRRQ